MCAASLPKVSVVCPWFNRADHIADTLDSLLAQTYPALEIVIVDDGSSDPRVQERLAAYDDPRLRVIRQENAGFTRAIRRAIAETDGAYIAIQGAGDVSAPHRLALQARFLQAHPDYALVGCGFRSARIPPLDPAAPFHGWDLAPGAPLPEQGTLVRTPTPEELTERNAFSHGEVMMRRAAYEAAGGYRPTFANCQDVDLWLRIGQHHKMGVLGEFLYERRVFQKDGIAPDLRKNLMQLAYSRLAHRCFAERRSGRPDSVERYGALAILKVPRDLKTTKRILRGVKQVQAIGDLRLAEIRTVRDLYGWPNYALAYLYGAYLKARYGTAAPPRRGG